MYFTQGNMDATSGKNQLCAMLSSNHFLTPFFETILSTRVWSRRSLSLQIRITWPHILQMSSQSASKSSHQQFGGVDGKGIPKCLVASRIAAQTIVGTAYRAYTGVWSLVRGRMMSKVLRNQIVEQNLRVVEVSPSAGTNIFLAGKAQDPQIID